MSNNSVTECTYIEFLVWNQSIYVILIWYSSDKSNIIYLNTGIELHEIIILTGLFTFHSSQRIPFHYMDTVIWDTQKNAFKSQRIHLTNNSFVLATADWQGWLCLSNPGLLWIQLNFQKAWFLNLKLIFNHSTEWTELRLSTGLSIVIRGRGSVGKCSKRDIGVRVTGMVFYNKT